MATTTITVAIITVALVLLACTAQTSHAQQLRAAGGGVAPTTQLVPYKPWREHSRRASTTSSPPPPAPTSVTVTPGDRFVRVSYQHPHATESGPNSGTLFRVQASPGSQWALSCPGCGDSGHGVTYVANLDNGVAYTFTVVGHCHHVSLMIPTGSHTHHHGCHAPCSLLTTHKLTLGSQTAIASDNQQSAPSLPSNPVTPAGTCPTARCLQCLSLATYPLTHKRSLHTTGKPVAELPPRVTVAAASVVVTWDAASGNGRALTSYSLRLIRHTSPGMPQLLVCCRLLAAHRCASHTHVLCSLTDTANAAARGHPLLLWWSPDWQLLC